jgi:hypothetical protein
VGGVPEDNIAILRRGFASFGETGSPDPSTLDPELEIINFESFPVTRPYHGLEGLMQWLADISEPSTPSSSSWWKSSRTTTSTS